MRSYQRQLPHLTEPAEAPPLEIPEHSPSSGLSVQQMLTIALYYWKQSALIAVIVIVLMAIFIKMMPKSYTATATLIVNSAHENPLPSGQYGNQDLGSYVATQAELLVSRAVLLPVVDELMLTRDPAYGAGLHVSEAEKRDYAARVLTNQVDVEEGRGGQLLYIAVTTGNPVQAAQLANAIADTYLMQDRERANNPVSEQAELSSKELAQLRANVEAAQANVTAFREKYGLGSIGEADAESQTLATLEARLLATQNERRTLEAQQAGQVDTGDQAMSNPRVISLRQNIATLQAELANLRPTLGPRHPQILGLEDQIRANQRELRAAIGNLSGNISTELSRTRALESDLSAAVATERQKLLKLRQIQDQGSKLELELTSAQSIYKQALDGFQQVKFDTAQNYANVDLVSHATPPLAPSKPKKMQLFILACLLGCAVGVALPFLYELLIDRRVRCRDDLERGLGVRVLAHLHSPQLSGSV